MNFETKFNLDETVFYISKFSKRIGITCKTCHGKGKVIIEELAFDCPNCFGDKIKMEYQDIKWTVSSSKRIKKISIKKYSSEFSEKNLYEDSSFYTLDSISGPCVPESEIFYTDEEAQAECDKRNKEIASK